MRFAGRLFLMLFALSVLFSQSYGRVIRVPQDEENIEDGLDRANAGDTVLVADGVYTGRDNYGEQIDRRVTLMSENGPRECIVDAQGDQGTWGFELEDDAVISGITIRSTRLHALKAENVDDWLVLNCIIERCRGGEADTSRMSSAFEISGSDGEVMYSLFRNNNALMLHGAAVKITNSSNVHFEGVTFSDNSADSTGGAVYVASRSDVSFRNCIFEENYANIHAGALAIWNNGTEVEVTFCNFISNEAQSWGGAIYKDRPADADIHDCIFWGNRAWWGDQIAAGVDEDNPLGVHHCIMEGGEDQEAGWFGDHLIEERARFERGRYPLWGPNNLYHHPNSPTINAGSAPADEIGMDEFTTSTEITPDEGMCDIGFHYSLDLYLPLGRLEGVVLDAENQQPMEGIRLRTSLGQSTNSIRDGVWFFANAIADTTFDLTASYEGYNDSTITDIHLEEGETLEFNFALYHPEFDISIRDARAQAEPRDTGYVDFTITNGGNGLLTWDARFELEGNFNVEPWTYRNSIDMYELVDDGRLGGVTFADGHFYVSGGGNDVHYIYKVSPEGALVDSFEQVGDARYGSVDLAYDGEQIWAVEDDTVYAYSLEGEVLHRTLGPLRITKCITWDADRELLWIAYTTNDILAVSPDSTESVVHELDRMYLRFYGLAYWSDDPDGYQLYALTQQSNDDTGYIYKFNVETGDTMHVIDLRIPGGEPQGGDVTSAMDPYSVNYLFVGDNRNDDRIDIYQLAGNTSWMILEPDGGIVEPETTLDARLNLFDARFDYGIYRARMIIEHNAAGRQTTIPIIFTIAGVPYEGDLPFPQDLAIESAYPNPFNAEISMRYSIPKSGQMSLKIFDLAGREIATAAEGYKAAGRYSATIDASQWSTGIYIAELRSAGEARFVKIACIK